MTHPYPSQVSAWTWTSRRRLVSVLCALVAVAGVSAAGWVWLESTRPADPLIFSDGLGFETPGRTGVRVETADRLRRVAAHEHACDRDRI